MNTIDTNRMQALQDKDWDEGLTVEEEMELNALEAKEKAELDGKHPDIDEMNEARVEGNFKKVEWMTGKKYSGM